MNNSDPANGPRPRHSRVCGIVLFLLLLLPQTILGGTTVTVQEPRTWTFDRSGVTFHNRFPGARLNDCTQVGPTAFRILIQPENSPINDSAWYAFEVSAEQTKTISITLAYENGQHRYRPKVSTDGISWTELARSDWTHDDKTNEATVTLTVGPAPIRVAGQEMIGAANLHAWTEELAQKQFVRKAVIGKSLLEQPLQAMSIGAADARNYVFILGRQHPPEITGTIGLIHFVENLAGDSDLAREFRRHFQTVVIPLMNPDGVDRGHWRHNMAGVDLNRDWMAFAQPETRAARDLFTRLTELPQSQPFLLLDFHSTHRDIFYTQEDKHPTSPENFTATWLAAIEQEFPNYELRRRGSHTSNHVTSKAWGYETFGIPSITYEFGDNTDRDLIQKLTTFAADEMMRLLLAEVQSGKTATSLVEEN